MATAYTLRLRMVLENAAFDEDRAAETARILRRLADRIEQGGGDHCAYINNANRTEGWLFDLNGNGVGEWSAKPCRYRD